ncbi:MAG TPA: RNA polymerase sigma factor [Gaiellales bacterium]
MDDHAVALERLYRARYVGFRNALATIVGSADAARDLVQEAFVRAYASRDQLRSVDSVEAWVWRIALRASFECRPLTDRLDADLPALIEPARDEVLSAALRTLPPRRRLIVFLHYYADLPYAQVAALCDVSEGTVAAALSQARDALRAQLAQERSTP